jgi:hypothetical protein
MTKRDLINFLAPFTDDIEVVVCVAGEQSEDVMELDPQYIVAHRSFVSEDYIIKTTKGDGVVLLGSGIPV